VHGEQEQGNGVDRIHVPNLRLLVDGSIKIH